MNEIKNLLSDKKSLYITLLLSLLYCVPLALADYDYLDDMGRSLWGYGWQHDGRFLATLLGKLWSMNGKIVSIYPFSLFLSALILGFTGYLLAAYFDIEKGYRLKWSSLLLLTSPAFLGNLVFKFDCLPMALSLLAVVVPYVFYTSRFRFAVASVLGVFLSLGLYQAGATVFFIVGSLFLIKELGFGKWRAFFVNLGLMVASFLIAFLGHISIIRIWNLPVSDRTETIFGMTGFINLIAERNKRFIERIALLLHSGWYAYLVSLFLIFCFLGMWYYFHKQKKHTRLSVLVPSLIFIMVVDFWLISGVNIIMKDSYWDFRTFCGLGFFLMVCMYFQQYLKGISARVGRLALFSIVAFSFVLVAQFGSVLKKQKEFQAAVALHLESYFRDGSVKKLGLIGTLTIAPANRFVYSLFPLFENQLSSPIGKYSAWSKEALNKFSIMDPVEIINSDQMECKGELVENTPYYHIRRVGSDTLIIDFNKSCP